MTLWDVRVWWLLLGMFFGTVVGVAPAAHWYAVAVVSGCALVAFLRDRRREARS